MFLTFAVLNQKSVGATRLQSSERGIIIQNDYELRHEYYLHKDHISQDSLYMEINIIKYLY